MHFLLILCIVIIRCTCQAVGSNIMDALRIQRDIAMNITIDQCLWPAIDMSTSYFKGNYSAGRISHAGDVLMMGYKRLSVDIYWNPLLMEWQLCPITANAIVSTDNYTDYTCDPTQRLSHFMSTVNQYLVASEVGRDSSRTDLTTIIFNIHQQNTSITTTNLSSTTQSLSDILIQSISPTIHYNSRIYTPYNLTVDRINTTASFFSHGQEPYFPLNDSQEIWPTWLYLIDKRVQLLIGLGTVDPTLTYFFTQEDKNLIFDAHSIGGYMNTTEYSDQLSDAQCEAGHQSWAFIPKISLLSMNENINKAISCNYSPLFMHAKDSTSLNTNIASTLWSWDIDEPDSYDSSMRCTVMQTSTGRWKVNDCSESLPIACRRVTNPNEWIITTESYNYDELTAHICPDDYIPDVPRVSSQNTLLHEYMIAHNIASTHEKVWLNLNMAFHGESCWVVGAYATCWWLTLNSVEYLGLIKTSIVAGVIILTLVGIFTWIKCSKFWRKRNFNSRKAMVKAMLDRCEYTTVPA
ncbi:hypothetical protein BDB01DRAFT_773666 [Pilobolus umbonatus]|nr:hypothetical protein BDB01DRAFT_773666 [Pilobolus umbonatus]